MTLLIDALRRSPNEEELATRMQAVLDGLDAIEGGYRTFQQQSMKWAEEHVNRAALHIREHRARLCNLLGLVFPADEDAEIEKKIEEHKARMVALEAEREAERAAKEAAAAAEAEEAKKSKGKGKAKGTKAPPEPEPEPAEPEPDPEPIPEPEWPKLPVCKSASGTEYRVRVSESAMAAGLLRPDDADDESQAEVTPDRAASVEGGSEEAGEAAEAKEAKEPEARPEGEVGEAAAEEEGADADKAAADVAMTADDKLCDPDGNMYVATTGRVGVN